MELIYIEWCDAIADTPSWITINDAIKWADNEDWVIKQSGFLLKETEEYILLCSKINPHDHLKDDMRVDSLLKLPKTWIRKRINLSNFIS